MSEPTSKSEDRKTKIDTLGTELARRLSIFAFRFSSFTQRVPWKLLLAAAAGIVLLLAGREHNARLRRDFELRQLRQQTAAQISDLRARAAAAQRDAASSAQRARDLEAQRQRLERLEAEFQSAISSLYVKEHAQLQQVATLPFPALAENLRRELGPGSFGTRDSGLVARQFPAASSQLSGAAAQHLSAPDNPNSQIQNSQSPSPGLLLTDLGARAMAAALVERDACREQSQAKDGLLENCREQAAVNRAVIEEMNHSLTGLKEAGRLKDEIQSLSGAAHRAELKAARGSRLRRFGRALQYVGAGVVIGVVVAQ